MRLREAGRGFAGRGECVRHTGGAECVCACVLVCVYMEVRYMSHGESVVVILSHNPPVCLEQANKQQHGTQRAALPRQTTDISDESMFFMNNEIPTQKHIHSQTNSYTCCTPHKKTKEISEMCC